MDDQIDINDRLFVYKVTDNHIILTFLKIRPFFCTSSSSAKTSLVPKQYESAYLFTAY